MGDRIATKLLRLLRLGNCKGEHACPFCAKPMVILNTSDPLLELDACRLCNVVWMDVPTYETLPQINIESTSTLAMQATEIVAMNRLRELKEKEVEERKKEEEERKNKKIGQAFGVLWNQK
jgi:Zn-finger nucleic acid-binding protein